MAWVSLLGWRTHIYRDLLRTQYGRGFQKSNENEGFESPSLRLLTTPGPTYPGLQLHMHLSAGLPTYTGYPPIIDHRSSILSSSPLSGSRLLKLLAPDKRSLLSFLCPSRRMNREMAPSQQRHLGGSSLPRASVSDPTAALDATRTASQTQRHDGQSPPKILQGLH